jgi:hypothetical protein
VKRRGRASARGGAVADEAPKADEGPAVIQVSDDLSAADLEAQLQAAMAHEVANIKTPPPRDQTPNSQAADKRLVERIMARQAQGLSLDGIDLTDLAGD